MARATTDYTDKDFDSLRARLFELITSAFPEWTDSAVANFGNLLVEMHAHVGDVLAFYLDALAREGFVASATLRRSMIALGRLVGYTLPGAAAATATLTVTLDAVPAANVTIPAGTVARTEEVVDPVKFQTLAALTIAAGTDPPVGTVVVEHSTGHTHTVDSAAVPNIEVLLDRSPFLDGSSSVTAGNGSYTEVTSFLSSSSSDRHYIVEVDQRDRATIRFGDGRNGAIPTGTITTTYKTGGGTGGNVEAGRIKVLEGSFTDVAGRSVRPTVTNAAAASGGADRMTVEGARLRIPEHVRLTTRTVTREDFELAALQVPGVARALMTTKNEDAAVAENAGILYVVPAGGGVPTDALLNAVTTMITVTRPHTLTFSPQVLAPIYDTINVWVRVTFADGAVPVTVREAIRAALTAWFRPDNADGTPNTNVDFGFNADNRVAWSDVFNVVRDTTGVRRINPFDLKLNDATSDVGLLVREFPALGTVTVVNAATGIIV